MKTFRKICMYISLVLLIAAYLSTSAFARGNNQIEVYKIGNNSITVKWTPYDPGAQTIAKYTLGYRVLGAPAYTSVDIDPTTNSPDYNSTNNEFSKKITALSAGTIYDVKLDVYIQGNGVPVAFYAPIKVMTKLVLDKTFTSITNPYGNDTVGHIDFAYLAPSEYDGVTSGLKSVNKANIIGYNVIVSATESSIYSSGQPYKAKYDNVAGDYKLYRITPAEDPLTYNGGAQQFSFPVQNDPTTGRNMLSFALYKTNQPSADDFTMASIYYVLIQPIFDPANPTYSDVISDATAKYETIENLATQLPLMVAQVTDDLVGLEFQAVGTGSMTYDIYKGRAVNSLAKIHTEYGDGTRSPIQYYNKIDEPTEGDIYYYKVIASNGVTSKAVPVTISLAPSVAPVINNIRIEKVIADTVSKSADVIISWDKPQGEDANKDNLFYRIYLNTDKVNQVEQNDIIHNGSGSIVYVNGKIALNTKVDINGNSIVTKDGWPVVFERVIEVSPSNAANQLNGSAAPFTAADPAAYFLANPNQNYYYILRDGQQVTRIIYRIKGADLLINTDAPQITGVKHTVYVSNSADPTEKELPTDYKSKVELNTTYFLKMDSYNSAILQKSDYSLTTGFTTPSDVPNNVPVPNNFTVNSITTTTIDISWDNINEALYPDNAVTYEVFMSDNGSYADSDFKHIKTPVISLVNGRKHLIINGTYTFDDDVVHDVLPNTVYLFKVGAKWNTIDQAGNPIVLPAPENYRKSEILPVTTMRTSVSDPEMTAPPAPIDFATTNVTSTTADFKWNKVDDFSSYRIVRTTMPIQPYESLNVTGNGVLINYDPALSSYTYTDPSLTANTLYYFSIRSEVVVNINGTNQTLTSQWITIPVTTTLVEAPTELALASRNKDGHSVTISWKGKASLNYESAKKDDSMSSYQISETVTGSPADPSMKVFQLTLQNLKSNTQYLIKVRAKDSVTGLYSKYTQPIQIRTEFNQTDYNNEVEDQKDEEVVSDMGQEWLKDPIQKLGSDSTRLELWVRSNKADDVINNLAPNYYAINLTGDAAVKTRILYVPISAIGSLNKNSKGLEVKSKEGTFYIKPWLLTDALAQQLNNTNIKSTVVKLQFTELSSTDASNVIPNDSYQASGVSDIALKIVGYNKSDTDMNTAIETKINDLVKAEMALVSTMTEDQLRKDLDKKIRDGVKGIIDVSSIQEATILLTNGKLRAIFPFSLDYSGKSTKYIAYIKNTTSSVEISGQVIDGGKLQFETSTFGKTVILGKSGAGDVGGNWAQDDIAALMANYDLSKELTDGKFRPDSIAKREEALSLVIDVLSPSGKDYEGLSTLDKAKKLGLVDQFPVWNLSAYTTKQELAYLVARAYRAKTGIDPDSVIASRTIYISDDSNIQDNYKKSVYFVLDNKFISNYSQNLFYPNKNVTRADVVSALANMLRKLGEI